MSPKLINNAHKLAYLVQQYPDKTMNEIIAMFQLSPMDINAAIWAAIELKLIKKPDEETGIAKFNKKPPMWEFGEAVEHLIDTVYYCFEQINAEEKDLEENYLNNWLMGYPTHDQFVAIKRLLENKQLAKYELEDGDSAYDFYTLYENREQLWGRKQFKNDPLETDKKAKK